MSDMQPYRQVVERRIGRAIKAILGSKERNLDPWLTDAPLDVSTDYRKTVLDELNDLRDVVGALFDALEGQKQEGVMVNEVWMERLVAALQQHGIELDADNDAAVADVVPLGASR